MSDDAASVEDDSPTPDTPDTALERYLVRRWRDDARLMRYAALVALILHPLGGLTDYAIIGEDPRLVPLLGARLIASALHLPIFLACLRERMPRRIELLVGVAFLLSVLSGVLLPTLLRPTSVASQGGPLLLILVLYALVFPAWRAYKITVFLAVSAIYVGIGLYWRAEIGYGGSHELITASIFLVAIGTLIPKVNRRIENTEFERFMAQDELSRTVVQLQEEVALRKRREEALEIARARAEQANRSKTSFMANVSHELRTPLVGILGVTELMRSAEEGTIDGPTDRAQSLLLEREARERVELLRQSGDYLLGLVNDLLDYFKLEAGKLDLREAPLSPRTLATTTIELVRPRITSAEVDLELDLDPSLPEWILGDGVRVQQIMLNLVGNSVKFTRSGSIRMRVRRLAGEDRDLLLLEVEDTGVGIAPEFIERIFEPFEQAGEAGQRAQGTGLGLAITRRCVEQMGGSIDVASELGVGTTIRVQLPLRLGNAPEDAGPRPERTAKEGAKRSSLRVLLAEDNPVNAKVLVAMLRRLGHTVTLVKDGGELVEEATRAPFDIILTDMFMPVLTGIEATIKLRALPAPTSEIPVLALTADAFEDQHLALRRAGIDAVLVKPLASQDLADALDRYVR